MCMLAVSGFLCMKVSKTRGLPSLQRSHKYRKGLPLRRSAGRFSELSCAEVPVGEAHDWYPAKSLEECPGEERAADAAGHVDDAQPSVEHKEAHGADTGEESSGEDEVVQCEGVVSASPKPAVPWAVGHSLVFMSRLLTHSQTSFKFRDELQLISNISNMSF